MDALDERGDGSGLAGNQFEEGIDGDRKHTYHDNQFVKLQKQMSMKAAMNIDMPMAKGIVDQEFLESHNVVQNRRAADPLGNFWKQNLNQIFKDF